MASISGEVRFNEARKILPDIQRRLYGVPCWVWSLIPLIVLFPVLFGLLYAWDLIAWADLWSAIPGIDPWNGTRWIDERAYDGYWVIKNGLFALVVIWIPLVFVCIKLVKRAQLSRLRKAMTERGVSLPCPITMTMKPDALVYDDDGVVSTVSWPKISEVFPSHGYWVFMITIQKIIIPRRFFADEATERAFIAEALGYLTEAARARSENAVKFVETGKL